MSDKMEPKENSLSVEEAKQLVAEKAIEAEDWTEYAELDPATEERLNFQQEAPGEDVGNELLQADTERADSWLSYNKGPEQTGYLPAERITPENVADLEQEYVIETDTAGMQTQPIIVPGDPPVMYFTDMEDTVFAVNARNGEQYWEFSPSIEREEFVDDWAVTNRNRGVTIWQDKVFVGTNDGYIVAVDRYTGEQQWRTDLLWEENLPEGMSESDYPQVVTGVTAAPVAYDGVVFTGSTTDQINWGSIHAIDAESGEMLWQTPTAEPDGWVEDTWAFGNSVVWMNPTVDPETETVIFNHGDPSSFYNTVHRPGPNKHSVTLRAFSFDGEHKWSNQLLAHEMWDYDCCSTATVTDATVGGEERRVVIEDAKDGWTHVLDIETGRYLRRSEPFARQEHKYGAYPESEYLNLVPFDEDEAGGNHPSTTGGSHWQPDGYSPKTNMRYVGNHDAGGSKPVAKGNFLDNVEYGAQDNDYLSAAEVIGNDGTEPSSNIVGIDLDTGEVEWDYDLEGPDSYMGSPGGPTATAGGVVFGVGASGRLVALDDETGEELWVEETDEIVSASPVGWDDPAEGKQYLQITANDKILVYALEAEVATETATEAQTEEPTEESTATDTDTDETETSGPGFGAAAGAAGVAGAAAAAKKRADDDDESDEE